MEKEKILKQFTDEASKLLLGKKIVKVRYLKDEEMEMLGWYNRSIVLQLEDGTFVFPSADDEGNNAGALFFSTKENPNGVIPVI